MSAYALTIHCRLDSEIPRSSWIEGSATFTIVASRITMNCARHTRQSTSQGLTPCARTFTGPTLPALPGSPVRLAAPGRPVRDPNRCRPSN